MYRHMVGKADNLNPIFFHIHQYSSIVTILVKTFSKLDQNKEDPVMSPVMYLYSVLYLTNLIKTGKSFKLKILLFAD